MYSEIKDSFFKIQNFSIKLTILAKQNRYSYIKPFKTRFRARCLLMKVHDFLFSPADFSERGDSSGGHRLLLGNAAARDFAFHAVGEVNQRIHVTLGVSLRKRVFDLEVEMRKKR